MSGWIKLHRTLKDWEWYDDHNATRLLLHLLLSVNYEDKKWKGIIIKSGSMVLSWETLSINSNLTIRQCRTAMQKLESSGEVTRDVTSRFQVVSLVKWEQLQEDDRQVTANKAVERQADDRQVTITKETKEIKEIKELKETIPSFQLFKEYSILKSDELNIEIDEIKLKLKYDSWKENGWKTGGSKPRLIKNWKSTLLNTLNYLQKEKSFEKKEKLTAAQALRKKYGISDIQEPSTH